MIGGRDEQTTFGLIPTPDVPTTELAIELSARAFEDSEWPQAGGMTLFRMISGVCPMFDRYYGL